MIRINLLAKEEIPKGRNFQIQMPEVGVFAPVFLVLAAVLACTVTFVVQKRGVDQLEADLALAREESQRLAPQIARIKQLEREREQLDRRLDAITSLDAERYFRVQLMSELSRRFPENAWLTGYTELSPSRVEIQGITFNNFVVADFLRDLAEGENYQIVDLVVSERGKIQEVEVLKFTLTADVKQPPVELATEL